MHTNSTTCASSSSSSSLPYSTSSYLPDTESSYLYPSSASSQEAVEGSSSLKGHSKKKARAFPPQEHLSIGSSTSVNGSMNPWDYQQLLESLEDLNGGNRGALSWRSDVTTARSYTESGGWLGWLFFGCFSFSGYSGERVRENKRGTLTYAKIIFFYSGAVSREIQLLWEWSDRRKRWNWCNDNNKEKSTMGTHCHAERVRLNAVM